MRVTNPGGEGGAGVCEPCTADVQCGGSADGKGGPFGNGTLPRADGQPLLNDAGHDYRLKNFFGWDLQGASGIYGPDYAAKSYVLPIDLMERPGSHADLVIVVGSGNSSNSVRLVEVALEAGAKAAYRVDDASEIDEAWLEGVESVSVTSGASVPEDLVEGVLAFLSERGFPGARAVHSAEESLIFALPPELRRDLRAAQKA